MLVHSIATIIRRSLEWRAYLDLTIRDLSNDTSKGGAGQSANEEGGTHVNGCCC
jgi:hypothetical protein